MSAKTFVYTKTNDVILLSPLMIRPSIIQTSSRENLSSAHLTRPDINHLEQPQTMVSGLKFRHETLAIILHVSNVKILWVGLIFLISFKK